MPVEQHERLSFVPVEAVLHQGVAHRFGWRRLVAKRIKDEIVEPLPVERLRVQAENAVSSRRDSDSKREAIWLVRWICATEGHGTRARTSRTAAWARHRPTMTAWVSWSLPGSGSGLVVLVTMVSGIHPSRVRVETMQPGGSRAATEITGG